MGCMSLNHMHVNIGQSTPIPFKLGILIKLLEAHSVSGYVLSDDYGRAVWLFLSGSVVG